MTRLSEKFGYGSRGLDLAFGDRGRVARGASLIPVRPEFRRHPVAGSLQGCWSRSIKVCPRT